MSDAHKLKQIATAAAELAGAAKGTGLSWDECVAVFGLAGKILATEAQRQNGDDSIAYGKKRLDEGYAQNMELSVVSQASNSVH